MMQYIADLTSLPPHICLLILAAAVLGLLGGMAIALLAILLPADRQRTRKKAYKASRPRKLKSPRRHRNESWNRAKLQAVMMVESGAFTGPTRR